MSGKDVREDWFRALKAMIEFIFNNLKWILRMRQIRNFSALLFPFILLLLSSSISSDSFNQPWLNNKTSIVIDAYEGNSIDWDEMSGDKKMVGVIHRSSIGLRVDKKYAQREELALERGYLWGAYHLGRPGKVIEQAELFLSLIGDKENTLMILDLEDTNSSRFMNLDEAKEFMDYVYLKTGKVLTVYANHSTTKKLNKKFKNDALFKKTKLWYARFKRRVTDYPAGIWPSYFLWQFSSEINCNVTGRCLYNVPGTSSDMDINVFNGSLDKLKNRWNNN